MTKDAIDVMIQHKSVRQFTSEVVDKEMLKDILNCGLRASNTGNMQLYSIIVTQQEPLRSELCKLHFGQCSTAPVWLTICADINRYHHYCRVNGCDEPYSNLLWFESATVDATLAAQNIAIAAETKGLGLCFLGTVMYNTKAIAKLLECPKGVVPVVTIVMGYSAEGQTRMSERLGQDAMVHMEKYHDYSDEEIIETHRVRDEFPFNKEMVKENKTRNYCEIFTTIRYPKKMNEEVSATLQKFIEENW